MPKIKIAPRDPMTLPEIQDMIARAKCQRDKALIAMLYLSGQRITEILKLTRGNIMVDPSRPDIIIVSFLIQKRRDNGSPLIPRHRLPLGLNLPFMDEFLKWANNFSEPSSRLFSITRQHAWEIVKKLNPNTYPHFFRHTRLSMLAESGASGPELMIWAGWSDLRPAGNYLSRSEKSLEKYANMESATHG
jgi:integrase